MRFPASPLLPLALAALCACSGAEPKEPPQPSRPVQAWLGNLQAALSLHFAPTDRPAASRLLAEILPWDARSLATHPRPQRLMDGVRDALVDELDPVPSEQRLTRLGEIACWRRGDRLLGRAVTLAVARWIADHGRPDSAQLAGFLDEAQPTLALGDAALADQVARTSAEVDAFAAAELPASCRERHRLGLLHARMALGSARTGSFATASGALGDFLRGAGDHPDILDVH